MGVELAFTRIKASFVGFSSIMVESICSLIISLSSSVVANAFLVSLTVCKAEPSLACIDVLSALFAVISRFSLTISFAAASSNRSGTASSFTLLEACCAK